MALSYPFSKFELNIENAFKYFKIQTEAYVNTQTNLKLLYNIHLLYLKIFSTFNLTVLGW